MTGHVAPHRWADAAAGTLSESALARAERHARRCPRCAAVRARVLEAKEAMARMRGAEPPPLHWDHIGARVYWATSSERRAAERRREQRRWGPVLGVAGALAAALLVAGGWLVYDSLTTSSSSVASEPAPPAPALGPSAPEPEVRPVPAAHTDPGPVLEAVVVFSRGTVELGGAPLGLDRPLRAGDRIVTRSGRMSAQFGSGDGFVVPEHSEVTIRTLREREVELEVSGEVYLDVKRDPARKVAVIAGEHTVSVRGTAFQVGHRQGKLSVSCTRGRVVVSDGSAEVEVPKGHRLQVDGTGAMRAIRATRINPEVIAALEKRSAVPMLPAWTGARDLLASTSTLRITAPAGAVEVDGVQVGHGSFALRVMSGRHHVQARAGAGEWATGKWVELGAGADFTTRIRPKPRESRSDRALRERQLRRAVARSNARACLRPLEKPGLVPGSFVVLDIGIDSAGAIRHLNVVKSNLPAGVVRCLRRVVDGIEFPAGPQATIRYRLGY